VLGSLSRPLPVIAPLLNWTAALSYAVYILHGPLLETMLWIAGRLLGKRGLDALPWTGLAFVAGTLIASQLAVSLYDEPVRRWLTRRLAVARPKATCSAA
jgi:peptidoglycan/LPS O-acetylase OafA/YrhL